MSMWAFCASCSQSGRFVNVLVGPDAKALTVPIHLDHDTASVPLRRLAAHVGLRSSHASDQPSLNRQGGYSSLSVDRGYFQHNSLVPAPYRTCLRGSTVHVYVQARVAQSYMKEVVSLGGLEADGGKDAGGKLAKDDEQPYYSVSLQLSRRTAAWRWWWQRSANALANSSSVPTKSLLAVAWFPCTTRLQSDTQHQQHARTAPACRGASSGVFNHHGQATDRLGHGPLKRVLFVVAKLKSLQVELRPSATANTQECEGDRPPP